MNFKAIILALAASALISCGDKEKEAEEKALMEKYDAQKKILADLEFTIERLESKVKKDQIPDPSEEINALKEQVKKMENQRTAFKAEISGLKNTKKSAEEKLTDYKRNYPLRSK